MGVTGVVAVQSPAAATVAEMPDDLAAAKVETVAAADRAGADPVAVEPIKLGPPRLRPVPRTRKHRAKSLPISPIGARQTHTERAQNEEGGGRSRRRGGRDRKAKQVGRYLVCVHVQPHATQISMLEGRSLVEHYVARAADETNQIDGNIYRGRVQNVLPGMEAAFIDIGIPKNAVLYRGDVRYDREDVDGGAGLAEHTASDRRGA